MPNSERKSLQKDGKGHEDKSRRSECSQAELPPGCTPKGSPDGYVAVVKEGTIMFEVAGVSEEIAREALRLASHKLPVKTKFVVRESGE